MARRTQGCAQGSSRRAPSRSPSRVLLRQLGDDLTEERRLAWVGLEKGGEKRLSLFDLAGPPEGGRGADSAAQGQIMSAGRVIILGEHDLEVRRRQEMTRRSAAVACHLGEHRPLQFARLHRRRHVTRSGEFCGQEFGLKQFAVALKPLETRSSSEKNTSCLNPFPKRGLYHISRL